MDIPYVALLLAACRITVTIRGRVSLLDLVKRGFFNKRDTILFWHTGGTPELFAWSDTIKI